jgi:molecular chaperone DnaJ
VPLATLDGDETLDIAPARSPTRCSPCAPAACRTCAATGRGDLHVHLDIQVPTKLDGKQEELLRDLARLRGEERPGISTKAGGLFGRRRR